MREVAAYVGWDWGEEEHEVRVRERDSNKTEQQTIGASGAALHEWAAQMRRRFGERAIAVCIETSRGAVIWALMAYAHIVLYPVNPKSAASFRETFYPSGKKDDPVDADVLLELVAKHQDKLRPLQPADAGTRKLAMLSEHRRRLVQDLVRQTNRLRANLKGYFPEALELVGELASVMGCDFLKQWPSLAELRRVREKRLRDFYTTHRSRSKELIDRRVEMVRCAVPLSDDEAVVQTGIAVTQSLVHVIAALLESIGEIEAQLKAIYSSHAEHDLIDSFPGLGVILGARVAALLGSDRERFTSDKELQQFTGIAPITKRSGGRNGVVSVQRRLKRSKFLHQTVVEWAGESITKSTWARAFYDLKRSEGKNHWMALRALGYKWLRVLFRCWKENECYDEKTYLAALTMRGSPIIKYLKAA